MNCSELAAALENQLLHERDAGWLDAAHRHAEHCPACSRLMALHRIEEQLSGLRAIEPSDAFLETVMSRIMRPETHRVLSSSRFSLEAFKLPMVVAGALILAAASVIPSAGGSWLPNLWPSVGPIRAPLLVTYLAAHPPWAILLATIAAVFVVLGLTLPDRPRFKTEFPHSRA
jgi:hypothetical protein